MTLPPDPPTEAEAVGRDRQGNLDRVRDDLAKAEQGGPASAVASLDIGRSEPATVEAAEQESSDGPQGRGLSR